MIMKKTPLCDLLGIRYPILQGGMLWLADGGLAAAVSNAGGLGVISPMAGMEPHGESYGKSEGADQEGPLPHP